MVFGSHKNDCGSIAHSFIVNVIKGWRTLSQNTRWPTYTQCCVCVSITLSCTLSDSTVRLCLSLLRIQIWCSLCLKSENYKVLLMRIIWYLTSATELSVKLVYLQLVSTNKQVLQVQHTPMLVKGHPRFWKYGIALLLLRVYIMFNIKKVGKSTKQSCQSRLIKYTVYQTHVVW